MPQIISGTKLRNGYSEVSSWCHETGEPVFVTRNGDGDLAVMSIEAYEDLTARLALYEALEEGHKDVIAGQVRPAREHLAELRSRLDLA